MPTLPKKTRKVTDIEGVTDVYAEKLKQCGIHTVDDLLTKAGSKRTLPETSKATGISTRIILEWVKRGGLLMIDGIGPDYARLLEKSGVTSAPVLALQDPRRLHNKLVKTNEEKKLVQKIPSEQQVARWIKSAPRLNRQRSY